MKIWNYNARTTRDNLSWFLDEYRDYFEIQLNDKETIPLLINYLREQYLLSEIEDTCGKLTPEQSERKDFGLAENLIVLKKNLTSKHKYSNTEITCFTRDFKKFYFWFLSYVELAETSRLVETSCSLQNKAA
jgi:hypothetical protein